VLGEALALARRLLGRKGTWGSAWGRAGVKGAVVRVWLDDEAVVML
jgi:hypothetical protein